MWVSNVWFFRTLELILLLPRLQWWIFGVELSMSLSFRFLKLNRRAFQVSSIFRSARAPPTSRNKAKMMLGPLIFILRLGFAYLFLLPASKLWDQRNRFKQFFLLHAKTGTISKSKWPTFVLSRLLLHVHSEYSRSIQRKLFGFFRSYYRSIRQDYRKSSLVPQNRYFIPVVIHRCCVISIPWSILYRFCT